MMGYGNALRNSVVAPPMGFGPGGRTGMPDFGGGFNPVAPGGMTMGGMRPPMNPNGGGGGWLGAITGALDGLDDFEKMYLVSSGIGGISDWWRDRKDRQFRERVYEEGREDERKRRESMGMNINAMWGG